MKKFKWKRFWMVVLLVAIVSGVSLTIFLTRSRDYCTLYVTTSYSGWGIDGQFLGSGSFEQEFRVKNGDCLYESGNGVWELNPKRNMFYEKIVEITEIGEDGVTVWAYRNGTVTVPYEKEREVKSTFTVADGINYSHEMFFSDYVVQ